MSIDWSNAPEWADALGEVTCITTRSIWFNDKVYMYVGDSRSYQWMDSSPELIHNHGRKSVTNIQLRPAPWTGEGLPPVGAECIITPANTIWGFSSIADYQCKVLAYHDDFVWVDLAGVPGVPIATRTDKVDFKPIRTPEQIAAEEREREVELAIHMINQKPFCQNSIAVQNGIRHAVGEMITAGYRKFEIVDKDDGEAV